MDDNVDLFSLLPYRQILVCAKGNMSIQAQKLSFSRSDIERTVPDLQSAYQAAPSMESQKLLRLKECLVDDLCAFCWMVGTKKLKVFTG